MYSEKLMEFGSCIKSLIQGHSVPIAIGIVSESQTIDNEILKQVQDDLLRAIWDF